MALVDPNIAMGYRGVEIPNQLAQYGQLAQIQNAQNQNQLAQYQLSSAQRADEQQNNLYAAAKQPGFALDFASALKYGAPGLAAFKAQQEAAASKLTQTKTQGEIDAQGIAAAQKRVDAFSTALAPLVSAVQSKKPITHDDVFGQATRLVAQGLLRQEDLASIPMKAEQLPSFVMNMASSTENSRKALETYLPKALIAGGDVINQNPLAAGGIGKVLGRVSMTDAQKESNQIARENLAVAQGNLANSRDRLAWEKQNPGFELKEGEDGTFYGVNKRTLQATPVTVGSPATAGATPVAATPLKGKGKDTTLTEAQGNATAYGMRMKEANAVLEPLEKAGKTNTGLIKNVVGGTVGLIPLLGEKLEDVSGSVFNALPGVLGGLSPEQQQVAQARINFITALLRKESGAAIGPSEFATAEKNYFPKPGDDAATIAQKQQARKTAIRAMEVQAGPGAKQMGGSALPKAGGAPTVSNW